MDPVDRLSRVQALIAGIAVENIGAKPFIGDTRSVSCLSGMVFYLEPV